MIDLFETRARTLRSAQGFARGFACNRAGPAGLFRHEISDDGRFTMSIFQIRQKTSGAILWTGSAEDERTALDAMAREAGYADSSALPDSVRAAGFEAARLDLIS